MCLKSKVGGSGSRIFRRKWLPFIPALTGAAVKTSEQRTEAENQRVKRGLLRSLVLEALAFVPVSTFVVLATLRYMLPKDWMASAAAYSLLGMISYAFPLVAFKQAVTIWVMRSLKGFYEVLSEAERKELDLASKPKILEKPAGATASGIEGE